MTGFREFPRVTSHGFLFRPFPFSTSFFVVQLDREHPRSCRNSKSKGHLMLQATSLIIYDPLFPILFFLAVCLPKPFLLFFFRVNHSQAFFLRVVLPPACSQLTTHILGFVFLPRSNEFWVFRFFPPSGLSRCCEEGASARFTR